MKKCFKKNYGYFIMLLFFAFSLFVLAFAFSSTNTYALTLGDDNNVYGDNLFADINNVYNGAYDNGVFTANTSNNTSASYYAYRKVNGSNTVIASYSASGYHSNSFYKDDNTTALSIWIVGNVADSYIEVDISFLTNGYYTISLNFIKSPISRCSFTDIMLNSGQSAIPYEPVSIWVDSSTYEKQSLYSLFNNTTVGLWAYSLEYGDDTSILLALDTLNLDVNQRYITINDMPNIKNVIIEGRSGSDWILNSNKYYISLYLNNQQLNFDVIYGELQSNIQYIRLTGSDYGLYDRAFYSTDDNQAFNISTMGNDYTSILLFNELGYNYNFRFGVSFSSSDYNQGYNDGYTTMYKQYKEVLERNGLLENDINGLNARIDSLEESVNNNFGFKNVFFAMADTPFKTVSNFLGFDIFGVNLFNALVGFITVMAIIWLLKKFI